MGRVSTSSPCGLYPFQEEFDKEVPPVLCMLSDLGNVIARLRSGFDSLSINVYFIDNVPSQ